VKAFAAIGLAFLAAPALADTTAVYTGGSSSITVEVATNGDARVNARPNGTYVLRRDGHVFFIAPDPSGRSHVFRASDFIAVRKELAESSLKQYPGLRRRIGVGEQEEAERDALVTGGEVTVRGRTGTAYFPVGGAEAPILVISHDPKLAPLRDAMVMSEQFADGMARAKVSYDPAVDQMLDILKTGAPLKLLDNELTEVRSDPIPPTHFDLPDKPETRDQLRLEWQAELRQPKR
jgi:hypothetical protein